MVFVTVHLQAEDEAASLVVKQLVSTAFNSVLQKAGKGPQEGADGARPPATDDRSRDASVAGRALGAAWAAQALGNAGAPDKEVDAHLVAVVDDLLGLLEQSSRHSEQLVAR